MGVDETRHHGHAAGVDSRDAPGNSGGVKRGFFAERRNPVVLDENVTRRAAAPVPSMIVSLAKR